MSYAWYIYNILAVQEVPVGLTLGCFTVNMTVRKSKDYHAPFGVDVNWTDFKVILLIVYQRASGPWYGVSSALSCCHY